MHSFDPKTKQNRSFSTASQIGTVVPKNKKEALIALVDGVYTMNLETGQTEVFADMTADLTGCRLNDGKCDPAGRLWVGSMHWQQETGKAKLFSIQKLKEKNETIYKLYEYINQTHQIMRLCDNN